MIRRRAHVGWEITCDAAGCTATTAKSAPPSFRKSPDLAAEAARTLGWTQVTIRGEQHWVCPLQQTFDPRLERWVARPLAVRA